MKLLLILAIAALSAQAQNVLNGTPNWIVGTSPFAPDPSTCRDVINVGSIFIQTQNPNNGPIRVLMCQQTGASGFTWQPIDHLVMATLPTKCPVGAIAFKTGVTAGQNLYGCTSANTWTQLGGGGGPSNSLTWNGGTITWN